MIKKIVTIVTALTVAAMMVSPASAATIEELLAQIAILQAQLVALQAQQGGTTTTSYTACVGVTFDRNLKVGMTGDDVKCLQQILNGDVATQVATSGAGSPGNETTYFGSKTTAAVVKFQEKYASDCLTPIGLTAGTGFVGSMTRAKLNSMLTTGTGGTGGTGGTTTPVGSGLTVTLASDNPAASTLVGGQSAAVLAKYVFTNGNTTEAKVTTLKLKRLGVSADTTPSNVYLFEGSARLTDAASVSSGVLTFNDATGLFKVPAGSSKTITVVSDIASVTGQTVGMGINAASDVTTDAGSVNGTFPVNGNLHSIASATLATVWFNANTYPATADIDPQNDYALWQNSVVVGNRAVNLTRIAFREIGTIAYADLQNFRLYIDGTMVGSAVNSLDSNGYVTFDLSAAPKRIEAGTRTIKVLVDIIGGSSRNTTLSLRVAADANFVDSEYGVTVLPTVTNADTAFSARSSDTQSINNGVVTITKMTDSPSGNVVDQASNVLLGKFQVKAVGERVKIETLRVAVNVANNTSTDIKLRNGRLFANGVQIGSTADIYDNANTPAYTDYSLGSSLIVEPGNPVTLEVRADIYDNDTTGGEELDTTDDTIQVQVVGGNLNNAQGMVSLATLDVPGTTVNGNALTNSTGGLTLAKYTAYVDMSIVPPVTNFRLAHYTLSANTTEDINVNTIDLDFTATDAFDASSDLSNLYMTYDTYTTNTKASVTDTNNAWAINYTLAAGKTINVMVYADVAAGATNDVDDPGTADTSYITLTMSGTTMQSATSATGGPTNGQTITYKTGSISVASTGSPANQAVAAGASADQSVTAANYRFTALTDSYTITELKVKVSSSTVAAALTGATLKDGSTVLATKPFDTASNTTAYFTGLNVVIPANTSKVLTVDLGLSVPVIDAATSGVNAVVTLDWYKDLKGSDGTVEPTDVEVAGNELYVYRTLPTFTAVDVSNTNFSNGASNPIYGFKVKADSKGDLSLKQVKFSLAWTDGSSDSTLKLDTFKLYRGSTDITSLVTIQDVDGNWLESTTTQATTTDDTIVVTWDTKESIEAGAEYTYYLYARPTGFVSTASKTNDDQLAVSMPSDTAHSGTDTFLWDATAGGTVITLAGDYAGTGASDYNVIWGDNSGLYSASSAFYTSGDEHSYGWSDSYLVNSLPLAAETFKGP